MADPLDSCPEIKEITEELQNNGPAAAVEKAQECLKKLNDIPLNIGITGESGSGKSTFVNAFRGKDKWDERVAPTGSVETTMEVTPYPHPNYPNVTLWDLPGIGTTNFPADKYLEHVGFEKFDFFIIISDTRFRENDVKLAKEIQKMGKKFYFVRSKIDHNLQDEKRSQRDFNKERTLAKIREHCIQGLQKEGVEAPQVFLVSSFDLHLYDFHLLEETLERELPAHKKNALLLTMPNINLEIIKKKKEALKAKIMNVAFLAMLKASITFPELTFATDMTTLVDAVREYQVTFGLDSESLQNLAHSAGLPVVDLRAVMTSPLAGNEVTAELIMKVLSSSVGKAALMAKLLFNSIPLLGIPVEMACSFTSSYKALNTFLDMLADDAQQVFKKALDLNTSV